eukprot:CAMPEP_0172935432 /NCGR_PEP_ID=MMETSP1075-20121228/221512_1 /TAXON_ID=2916 /ORGANISM="Ceratium fusus, Strain PA161109" /LENGTH=130 /DNA_ID=CAMNT_0013796791 /DNA_START=46 /DNA_END=438 /DNA_ORIENTATION=+
MAQVLIRSGGRALSALFVVAVFVAAAVAGWSNNMLFASPQAQRRPPMTAQTRLAVLDNLGQDSFAVTNNAIAAAEEARVEELRQASLEACLIADEGNASSVDRCLELTYDLALAKQIQEGNTGHLDSDSY